MKVVKITLIATILVLILSTLTSAQIIIGEPVTFSGSAGTLQYFFSDDSTTGMSVCLAVESMSISRTVQFTFKVYTGTVLTQQVSSPYTICHNGIAWIAAEWISPQCTSTSPCNFVYQLVIP